MNILYITGIDVNIKSQMGILKKVLGQANAIQNKGHNIYICYHDNNDLIIKDDCGEKRILNCSNKLQLRINKYRILPDWCIDNNINAIYIRFDGIEPIILSALQKMKRNGITIILELPTFPFNGEVNARIKRHFKQKRIIKGLLAIFYKIVSNLSYIFAQNYIDRIVTYMKAEKIWGIPVMEIDNGITVSDIKFQKKENSNNIIFGCVANVSHWHGLDRLIEGLSIYNNKSNIMPKLWIIGEGSQLTSLKQLVDTKHLNEYVTFWGNKEGKELDELMTKFDIGIGSLGLHRIGLNAGSTLKIKEYCARGIPFIYSYIEKQISDDTPYALRLAAGEQPIDIKTCMEFASRVGEMSEIQKIMRNDAYEKFDWSVQMEPVINYIESVSVK